jgi:rod shape-determining protein MreC
VALSRRTGRSRFTLLLLVLTSITVITLDFRGDGSGVIGTIRDGALDALAPVRSAVDDIVSPVTDVWGGVTDYSDLEEENARLRDRIAQLEESDLEVTDALRERAELLDLLNLKFAADIPQVAARVVSAPVSNFELTIVIDRGRHHGVRKDMPVVAGGGLVGRVVQASDTRAVVLLITDPTSAIGVRLARTGEVGVAEGRGRQRLLDVEFIDFRAKVRVGEPVVTSGLQESIFPPSIPVGRVTSAKVPTGSVQQEVTVEPAVDLQRIEFVKVLQWRPTTG